MYSTMFENSYVVSRGFDNFVITELIIVEFDCTGIYSFMYSFILLQLLYSKLNDFEHTVFKK